MDELYEGTVKQQMLSTLNAYQEPSGIVDLDGWLADTCAALGFDAPGSDWREWAYYVIGQAELDRPRLLAEGITPWWDKRPHGTIRRITQ